MLAKCGDVPQVQSNDSGGTTHRRPIRDISKLGRNAIDSNQRMCYTRRIKPRAIA
jgi:hypothetical protein